MKRSGLLLLLFILVLSGCGCKQPDTNPVSSDADVTPSITEESLLITSPTGVVTEAITPTLISTPIPTPGITLGRKLSPFCG